MSSQTGEMAFINFDVIIRHLCISLTPKPKAAHYFENTLELLTENNIFELTYYK